ncbi:hypothetical protein [Candidatus Leptofilum sp.]|uniref:hypothetical protein n=1 Tax=Candidatus Leptofilum sp. TaxID=3241576 RepID=UPI003B5ABDE3
MSIRAVFEQFRTATKNGDGDGAVEVVSSLDVEWYDYLLVGALTLEREELGALATIEKFIILRLRHNFSLEELENLTGEDVIILSFERGWIDLSYLENFEIDEVDIGIDPGNALVTFADGTAMFFYREGGRHWKVSLGQFMSQANEELNQIIRESGIPEDQFFTGLLELLSERPVDERIFDGPIE